MVGLCVVVSGVVVGLSVVVVVVVLGIVVLTVVVCNNVVVLGVVVIVGGDVDGGDPTASHSISMINGGFVLVIMQYRESAFWSRDSVTLALSPVNIDMDPNTLHSMVSDPDRLELTSIFDPHPGFVSIPIP